MESMTSSNIGHIYLIWDTLADKQIMYYLPNKSSGNRTLSKDQQLYNNELSKHRVIIENCYGRTKKTLEIMQ